MIRQFTPAEIERIRRIALSWYGGSPPCGIPHFHPYNPCLPEPDQRGLICLTCGLRQRLELTRGLT